MGAWDSNAVLPGCCCGYLHSGRVEMKSTWDIFPLASFSPLPPVLYYSSGFEPLLSPSTCTHTSEYHPLLIAAAPGQ